MSGYKFINTTNGRTTSLDKLLLITPVTPQSVSNSLYKQGESLLQFENSNMTVNSGTSIQTTIEKLHPTLTGYKESGTELFSQPTSTYANVCSFYIERDQPTFTSPYNVSQYSSCTIIISGGGGGGGGGGGPSYLVPIGNRTEGGAGGLGGDGGMAIYKDIAIPTSVNTISFSIGNGGAAGQGGGDNNISQSTIFPGNAGGDGNNTTVTIGSTTYTCNGGQGGEGGQGGPRNITPAGGAGAAGTPGSINPSTSSGGTGVASFNSSVIYQGPATSNVTYSNVNGVINMIPGSGTNTSFVQGGNKGNAGQPSQPLGNDQGNGNDGGAGGDGYCRIYFYK